jgi:hypothetical protein
MLGPKGANLDLSQAHLAFRDPSDISAKVDAEEDEPYLQR